MPEEQCSFVAGLVEVTGKPWLGWVSLCKVSSSGLWPWLGHVNGKFNDGGGEFLYHGNFHVRGDQSLAIQGVRLLETVVTVDLEILLVSQKVLFKKMSKNAKIPKLLPVPVKLAKPPWFCLFH